MLSTASWSCCVSSDPITSAALYAVVKASIGPAKSLTINFPTCFAKPGFFPNLINLTGLKAKIASAAPSPTAFNESIPIATGLSDANFKVCISLK